MSSYDEHVKQVCADLQDGRLAIMAGAGISCGRQSWLPRWDELIYSLLRIVGGPEATDEVEYISKHHMHLLFNEVFLQQMVRVIGLERTAEAIGICMDTNSYSAIHKFLAWSMLHFGSVVLTTNYDELIEKASGWKATPIKIHGTLGKLQEARFTVDKLFAPLDASLVESVAPKISGRTLLVVGYRGADEFDVIPFLFEQAKSHKFIWMTHDAADDLDASIKRRLTERRDPYFQADADQFLQVVYQQTKNAANDDDELDCWQAARRGNAAQWWLPGLKSWGKRLSEESQRDVDYLWAQILDYLRIYRLEDESGAVRKPAGDAYARFLKTYSDPIRALECDAQIAYIKRITRDAEPPDLLVHFQTTIARIWEMLDKVYTSDERSALQILLTRTYHQFGVALQNIGAHSQASSILKEAARYRRLLGDRNLPYSVFQQFMNGRQAHRSHVGHIDEFAPRGWRNWLVGWMERCASSFQELHEPEHYGNTLHNLAFVHQFLAEEHEEADRFEEARKDFLLALSLYQNASEITERLRDPRMITHIEVRIAECKLGCARDAYRQNNIDLTRNLVEEAARLADAVDRHYDEIPQERFRREDVTRIRQQVKQLREECLR